MGGRIWIIAAGLSLVAAGCVVWALGDFTLPARRPPTRIQFSGFSRMLAGAAPALLGAALLALGRDARDRDGALPQLLSAAAVAAAVLAFLLAERIR